MGLLINLNFELLLLFFFSVLVLVNSFFVLFAKNFVHSILYLVVVFCNVSCILLLLGVDFIAAIFLMVYAGAIAMLFVFVFMMLDIKKTSHFLKSFHTNIWKSFFLSFFLFLQIFFIIYKSIFFFSFYNLKFAILGYVDLFYKLRFLVNFLKGVGLIFYTVYSFSFLLSSLLLLIGMVSTIMLVLDYYPFYSFFFYQQRGLLYKSKFFREFRSKHFKFITKKRVEVFRDDNLSI